nr:phosphotransferase [Roseibium sp. RKSG952]
MRALPSGYSCRFWELRSKSRIFIIKEFFANVINDPLYAVSPEVEVAALSRLNGVGLAPELAGSMISPDGNPMVIYTYVPAKAVEIDVKEAAQLLGSLAGQDVSNCVLKKVPSGAFSVLRHADGILARITNNRRAENLRKLRPQDNDFPDDGPGVAALVHRTLCLGTLLSTNAGPRLIDWQYAGIGDPAEDLACFLSPGLLSLYGLRPLPAYMEERFIRFYPDSEVLERFKRERMAYHWRIAAYCLFRQEMFRRTHPPASRAYGRALEEEIDLLLRLRTRS